MGKSKIIDETINKLLGDNSRLKEFQKETVKNIVEKFDKMNRVLLADEVGLGKTEIAKGVIARMAEKHCESGNKDEAFKVAYICPNLNVASQNFPKLRIFAPSFKNDELSNDLKRIKLNPDSGVHTRIRDILIKLTMGESVNEAIDSKVKDGNMTYRQLYLVSGAPSSEWSNEYNEDINNTWKSEVLDNLVKILKEHDFPYAIILENITNRVIKDKGLKFISNKLYQINKEFIIYLINGGVSSREGSRLSMQHLYSSESRKINKYNVMNLEALTPQTSFKITNLGTLNERALIAATLDYCVCECQEDDKKQCKGKCNTKFGELLINLGNANKENYVKEYFLYKDRLKAINFDRGWISAERLEEIKSGFDAAAQWYSKGLPEDINASMKKLRREFIRKNLESLKYDLVIMDEFQNFSELTDIQNPKDEVSIIAKEFFNKTDTKVLLLSATPFKLNYIKLNLFNEDVKEEDKVFDDFYKVIRFLYNGSFDLWKEKWIKARIEPGDIYIPGKMEEKKQKCEELLFEKTGLVRTERIAALKKTEDMFETQDKTVIPDFYCHLKIKKLLGSFKDSEEIKSLYPISYSKTTPYALSFSDGYKILGDEKGSLLVEKYGSMTEKERKEYSDLFLKVKKCKETNKKYIMAEEETLHHPVYEEYKGDLFDKKDNQYPIYYMLWIPPSNCGSKKLSGAFKRREGFSKELIFSEYKMTPKSLTFLLCKEVGKEIKKNGSIAEVDEQGVKEIVNHLTEKVIPEEFLETQAMAKEYFVKLFLSEEAKYIISAVKKESPGSYAEKIRLYCEDGCFDEMLTEYFELLKAEYDCIDNRIARSFESISKLRLSNINLILYNIENNRLEQHQAEPENKFAMGLFSEKANEDTSNRLGEIQKGFKSPFWPFVFITTSIGTEGIDLHWYARNVVHWTLPNRPIDIEQREGRVLRYNCHAIRLNSGMESSNLDELWKESGMHPNFLNFNNNGYKIVRKTYFEKLSKEEEFYNIYRKVVSLYRMLIGQADTSLFDLDMEIEKIDELQKYFICLSPYYHRMINNRILQMQNENKLKY